MEKFTAVFEQDGDWWIGYLEELPGHQYFRLYRFVPRKTPAENTPLAYFPSKNFEIKKSPWVPGDVGLGPWQHRGGWG